jgi:hypothetical protein
MPPAHPVTTAVRPSSHAILAPSAGNVDLIIDQIEGPVKEPT